MVPGAILFFCCCAALPVTCNAKINVTFWDDPTSLQVEVQHTATIVCCYNSTNPGLLSGTWIFNKGKNYVHVNNSGRMTTLNTDNCHKLLLSEATLNDTGLYRCLLKDSLEEILTPGTFLQVYSPMPKAINISESSKNRILVAEGILLLLCLVVPGIILIRKTYNEMEKKTTKIEEENIYEGLNLDECSAAYHQIQRSQMQSTYQDVDNVRDDDIQLEKP
ncbi:B-cell antigen receptor complex-associated protein alpha chain [Arapaima gigas]